MPEQRLVLANCGVIDPGDIETYLDRGGFKALGKVRTAMTPEEVIGAVRASGLRGRGGAGFDCGLKWEMARGAEGETKFLICNADEGEVGTFKDRFILENDPFTLIEGIALTAYAIGARKAYIYLRAEYHRLLDRLTGALGQAKEKGFPGIINTDPFHPGMFVNIEQAADGRIIDYSRTENFATGEVVVRWTDDNGEWIRRTFF